MTESNRSSNPLCARLRGQRRLDLYPAMACEAADEIDRLTARVAELEKQLLEHAEVCGESAYPISMRPAVETDAEHG